MATIALVFTADNNFQQIAYLDIVQKKHPNHDIIIISPCQLVFFMHHIERAYIVLDFVSYLSTCVCPDADGKIYYILDEFRRDVSSVELDYINKEAHEWVRNGKAMRKPKCKYCETSKSLSKLEFEMLSLMKTADKENENIRGYIMRQLDIDRKAYSRILHNLLDLFFLRNEYALIKLSRLYLNFPRY